MSDGTDIDYVVVGSGAGGGTVAARLAEAGRQGAAAGSRRRSARAQGGVATAWASNRLPDDYDVPAFHPFASENEALRWDFFVRHYDDEERQERDPKYRASDGRPATACFTRAPATLGGCTAHNAMILVCPHECRLGRHRRAAPATASWSAASMQRYFRRLEDCRHRPVQRELRRLGIDRTGHGWDGWLQTEKAMPARRRCATSELRDARRRQREATFAESGRPLQRLALVLRGRRRSQRPRPHPRARRRRALHAADDPRPSADGHARARARGRGAPSPTGCASSSTRWRPACCSTRTTGPSGSSISRASGSTAPMPSPARPRASAGRRMHHARSSSAGGAFNTPQLLMLSGIGPRDMLRALRHRGAGRPAGRRPEPAGPLRGLRRQPHDVRALGVTGRGALRQRRSAVSRRGRPAATASMPPTAPAWR